MKLTGRVRASGTTLEVQAEGVGAPGRLTWHRVNAVDVDAEGRHEIVNVGDLVAKVVQPTSVGMVRSTRTFTTFFDGDEVDRLVGGAYDDLLHDYEERRAYIDASVQTAIEERLELLRIAGQRLKDRAD